MPIRLLPNATLERSDLRIAPLSNGTYILGRSRSADLFVSDPNASRRHARLVVSTSGADIEDLASKNGTLLNDLPLNRRQRVADGDCITIGTQRFFVHESLADESPSDSRHTWDDGEPTPTFDQTERTLDLLDVLLNERHSSDKDALALVPLVVSAVDEVLDTVGTTRPELTARQAVRIGRLIGSLTPRAKSASVRAWQLAARRRLNALVRQNTMPSPTSVARY